jgi:hypothetical protein
VVGVGVCVCEGGGGGGGGVEACSPATMDFMLFFSVTAIMSLID